MKQVKIIAVLSVYLCCIFSCEEEQSCLQKDGIIGEGIYSIYLGKCYTWLDTASIIVNHDTVFNTLIALDTANFDAKYCTALSNDDLYLQRMSSILDLEHNTLLGLRAEGEGCSVGFEKKFTYEAPRLYKYLINVYQCGECEIIRSEMLWILVPKINDTDSVIFEVYNPNPIIRDSTIIQSF